MLTPKCPPRDFRVSARENSTKNRLYRFKWYPGGRNLAGFCEEFASLAMTRKFFYINDLVWLCWETAANVSQRLNFPVKRQNTGKFRRSSREGGKTARFSDYKSVGYAKIPYAPEQGILELTGNVSRIAGKVAWAKSPVDGIFGKDRTFKAAIRLGG